MWSVCWYVTRSRSVRWSANVVCLLVFHQVQVCEVAGSSHNQVDLQSWQHLSMDRPSHTSAVFSHPSSTSAQIFSTPHIPTTVDSSSYPSGGSDKPTSIPAAVAEQAAGATRPVSKSSVVSVPVLSAAGTPLELLVQVPQTAATAEAAEAETGGGGDGEPPDKPATKKRLRQRNHVCDICGHRCAYPKDLKRHKFKHMSELRR